MLSAYSQHRTFFKFDENCNQLILLGTKMAIDCHINLLPIDRRSHKSPYHVGLSIISHLIEIGIKLY